MRSHLMCAFAFSILFTFLALFIPLFLIYAHLESLNTIVEQVKEPAASCPSYQLPCEQSSLWNQTKCIDRNLHCDTKYDCPNGEDEENCDDISRVVEDLHRSAMEKMNQSSSTFNVTSASVTSPESNQHKHFPKCSLVEIATGICQSCDYSHEESVICKAQNLTGIPTGLLTSIKTLNLDDNNIIAIDGSAVNQYTKLTVLSLRNNQISYLRSRQFYRLSNLRRLYLRENLISRIDIDAFYGLVNMRKIYLSFNKLTTGSLRLESFEMTPELELLDLSHNELETFRRETFPYLERLSWLELEDNKIDNVENTFQNLPELRILTLGNNNIRRVSSHCFSYNSELTELDLGRNSIETMESSAFANLSRLSKLNLDHNPLTELPVDVFHSIPALTSLNMTEVFIDNMDVRIFASSKNLTHVYFSKFRYCMFAPRVRVCRPFSDGLSSIDHLLVHPILRNSVWFVAIFTCIGNLLVIVWRSISSKEDEVLALFVQNLSVSDFLMGVYLLTIGSYDSLYADRYSRHALQWMHSWSCSFCGFIAMLSSELSVLVLTLITVERYRCITANFAIVTTSSARWNLLLVWFIALSISSFPLFYWSNSADSYYGSSGVCFPLHIDEPMGRGWLFSALVLIGVNLTAVLLIVCLYFRMFSAIKNDRRFTRPALPEENKKREDVILAFRFFAIVLTDCLCWLPIVAVKVLAFTSISISPTWNAWLVVFVLPINSALNPVIYTIAAPTELHQRIYRSYCRLTSSLVQSFVFQKSLSFMMDKDSFEAEKNMSYSLNDASDANHSSNSRNSRRTRTSDVSL